ncbi:MAG: M20 aminoacylase family protein [Alphaproteobacteria bacterium]
MEIKPEIADLVPQMTAWRRDIHANPETAFEETRTAAIVAEKLRQFGLEVHQGLAETGVVGRLKCGTGNRAIGLRADMDALDILERNGFDHRSRNDGKMHACGHDGHTTMLLGAAHYLAKTKQFDGTIFFIFQPAEENEGGARVMIEEGLFEKFPVESVYGMHNMPGIPVGEFAVRPGPMMAAFDIFEVTVTGRGSHAAMPHQGIDPIIVSSEIVSALQTIPSRATNPLDAVVVSITQIHGGDTWNVIPNEVVLRGTCRSFNEKVQDALEPAINRIVDGICAAHGASATVTYERRYPSTVNTVAETEIAAAAAVSVVGAHAVDRQPVPMMGSEDFAYMLKERPGCYMWVGNGPGESGCMLHNPHYDFNDEVLPIGASYWAALAESLLPIAK